MPLKLKIFTMENVTGIFLRKEVSELRKKGESWGLTKEEVDEAILRALGERLPFDVNSKDENKSKQKPCSRFTYCLKVTAWIVLLPIVLYTIVAALSAASPKTGLYIGHLTADLQYPVQRMVRFMSLPLHRHFDMSKLSEWECMIDNPLFVPEKPDCSLCQTVKKIVTRSSANLTKSTFKKRFYDNGLPVIIRDMPEYANAEHSFEKFMEFFRANQAELEQDACEFYINGTLNESVKNVTEFLQGWDHYKPEGNIIAWKTCYGKGLRKLRSVFPRPYCIHSEGALDKNIYLMQPAKQMSDGATEVPQLVADAARGAFDNIWLAQVTGSSSVGLYPVDECEKECEKFEFTLDQGDVFFFSQHTWMATVFNERSKPAMIFSSAFA